MRHGKNIATCLHQRHILIVNGKGHSKYLWMAKKCATTAACPANSSGCRDVAAIVVHFPVCTQVSRRFARTHHTHAAPRVRVQTSYIILRCLRGQTDTHRRLACSRQYLIKHNFESAELQEHWLAVDMLLADSCLARSKEWCAQAEVLCC